MNIKQKSKDMKQNLRTTILLAAFIAAASVGGYAQDGTLPVIPPALKQTPSTPAPKPVKPAAKPKPAQVQPTPAPAPYNPPAPANPSERGVVINGVKWATCNVAAPGAFANKPEDAGKFYQWNRKKAWATTGNVTGWDSSTPTGTSWEKANDPSPAGWRVPDFDEIKKLLDANRVSSIWTTQNGVNGRKFTDKTTGNSIFLPAAGRRYYSDGALYYAGTYGNYWSSTQSISDDAYYLGFGSGYADWYYYYRDGGFTVRSVAE